MISYKRIFHIFIWILFFSFLVLYFASMNGYYADLNNKKSSLTLEKVKKFEKIMVIKYLILVFLRLK